jgi:peroxiredoxin
MRLVTALAVLAIVVGAYFFFIRSERPPAPPADQVRVGAPAPDFTLKDLQGNAVTLSEFKGKVVFLNFWATWCPPCRVEMPSMERLYEVYGDRGFVMLAVNVEQAAEPVLAFLKENPHAFPILLDPDARVQRLYGVYRFPETFLIDQDGTVVEHYLGARDWSSVDFLAKIKSMLEG